MKIIDLTRELIRCYLDRLDNRTQLLYVKKIMAENNIPNRPVEGENLFKKKWSKLSSASNPQLSSSASFLRLNVLSSLN